MRKKSWNISSWEIEKGRLTPPGPLDKCCASEGKEREGKKKCRFLVLFSVFFVVCFVLLVFRGKVSLAALELAL